MGEARRNLEADAAGVPRPRDNRCPACGSKKIHDMPATIFPECLREMIDQDWQGCIDCRAVWEPFPRIYARDPVCAEPCDNCAFQPGSPEQKDPARWRELLASLKPTADGDGWFGNGQFYCHKGVPIDLSKGPGNFLFPQRPLSIDDEVVLNSDGTPVLTFDLQKMRTCSGFLRMVWAHRAKSP